MKTETVGWILLVAGYLTAFFSLLAPSNKSRAVVVLIAAIPFVAGTIILESPIWVPVLSAAVVLVGLFPAFLSER